MTRFAACCILLHH